MLKLNHQETRPLETLVVVPGHMGAVLEVLDQRVSYSVVAQYWPSLSVEAIFPGDSRLLDLSPVWFC